MISLPRASEASLELCLEVMPMPLSCDVLRLLLVLAHLMLPLVQQDRSQALGKTCRSHYSGVHLRRWIFSLKQLNRQSSRGKRTGVFKGTSEFLHALLLSEQPEMAA
jgi:hypothetical protein